MFTEVATLPYGRKNLENTMPMSVYSPLLATFRYNDNLIPECGNGGNDGGAV